MGGYHKLGHSMLYKALRHCKHLGLDLSLGFHFHCQFTGLLMHKCFLKLWHQKVCDIIRLTFIFLCIPSFAA
jgi:hypothetical protein